MESVLPLPSKGLVYDVPLENIKVRTMKGRDEKLLAEMTIDNAEKKYLELLKNVVTGIDVNKLTLGDRLYILVWLRINSYSPTFPVKYTCNHCFEDIELDIDLTKLDVKELEDTFKEPFNLILNDGKSVSLRLFRIADEVKIAEWEKRTSSAESYVYRWALSIVNDEDVPTRMNYYENLDSVDTVKIRKFHEEAVHGPELDNVSYDCPKCGSKGVLSLPFRPDFLLPRGKEIK